MAGWHVDDIGDAGIAVNMFDRAIFDPAIFDTGRIPLSFDWGIYRARRDREAAALAEARRHRAVVVQEPAAVATQVETGRPLAVQRAEALARAAVREQLGLTAARERQREAREAAEARVQAALAMAAALHEDEQAAQAFLRWMMES